MIFWLFSMCEYGNRMLLLALCRYNSKLHVQFFNVYIAVSFITAEVGNLDILVILALTNNFITALAYFYFQSEICCHYDHIYIDVLF